MAKTSQSGSASQRRAQERQQRQRKEEVRASALSKGKASGSRGRGPTVRRKDRTGLYMGIGVTVLIAVFIAVIVILRNQPVSVNPAQQRTPADAVVVQQLTSVPQSVWETVGKGSVVKNAFTYNHGQPPLIGPNGLPEFFYVGGEFCPYCGAERWAMINALGRFGTFSNLSQIQAYEYNVPTFSFYGSKYSSQYIDFVPKEIKGNALDSSQQSYVDLEKLTASEQQTFQKYDSGQSFPFVDIGNLYTGIGASYDFTILLDSKSSPLSWQTIASSLGDPKSAIAQGVLGSANYMTAGICSLTKQQPSNVCDVPIIQQLQQTMSGASGATPTPTSATTPTATPAATPTKTSYIPGSDPLALASDELQAAQRRGRG